MPNGLAAIGRSTLSEEAQRLSGLALGIRGREMQQAINLKDLKMREETHAVAQQKAAFEEQERVAGEKLIALTPWIEAHVRSPRARGRISKAVMASGYGYLGPGGELSFKRKDRDNLAKVAKEQSELGGIVDMDEYAFAQENVKRLERELSEITDPNNKQAQILQAELKKEKGIAMNYAVSLTERGLLEKEKAAVPEITPNVGPNPESSTGFSFLDKAGKPIAEAPVPKATGAGVTPSMKSAQFLADKTGMTLKDSILFLEQNQGKSKDAFMREVYLKEFGVSGDREAAEEVASGAGEWYDATFGATVAPTPPRRIEGERAEWEKFK